MVLKVYGQQLSGGLKSHLHLPQLLRLYLTGITDRYIAVFKIRDDHPFVFSITRYVEGSNCRSQLSSIKRWWSENQQEARERFFSDVYRVAFTAIRRGYFHWDVRLKNILFTNDKRFVIIDLESVVAIDQNVGDFFNTNNSGLLKFMTEQRLTYKVKVCLVMFERLLQCLEMFGESVDLDWISKLDEKELLRDPKGPTLEKLMQTALLPNHDNQVLVLFLYRTAAYAVYSLFAGSCCACRSFRLNLQPSNAYERHVLNF